MYMYMYFDTKIIKILIQKLNLIYKKKENFYLFVKILEQVLTKYMIRF